MIFHQGFIHHTEEKFYWIFLDWIIPNLDFGRIITSNWAQTFKMCETLGNFELEQVWLFVTNSFCVFAALGCNIFKFGKFCEIQTISSLSSNMLGRGGRWSSLCVFAITFQQIHTNTCQVGLLPLLSVSTTSLEGPPSPPFRTVVEISRLQMVIFKEIYT